MSKLKNRLLEKLKENHVQPIPKGVFMLKNFSIWGAFLLFEILGIFSIMFIFYFGENLEIFSFILDAPKMLPKILFVGIPFFWLVFAIGFIFFAGFSIGKTKKGYKLSRFWIFFAGVLIPFVFGALLSQTAIAEKIERGVKQRIRLFEGLDQKKERLWQTPEHGFLSGKIKEISSVNQWIIVNFKRDEWTIRFTEKTILPNEIKFEIGQKIRIQGKLLDKDSKVFEAQKIFPFQGDRRHFRENMKNIMDRLPPEERDHFRENMHPMRLEGDPENREFFHQKRKEVFDQLPEEERKKIQENREDFKEGRPPEGRMRFFEERGEFHD